MIVFSSIAIAIIGYKCFATNKFSWLVKMVPSRTNVESGTDVSNSLSSQSISDKAQDKNILNNSDPKLRSETSVHKETSI